MAFQTLVRLQVPSDVCAAGREPRANNLLLCLTKSKAVSFVFQFEQLQTALFFRLDSV